VRISQFIDDRYILQLDVEELIHALESPLYRHIIFKLDGDLVIDESFEEARMMLAALIDNMGREPKEEHCSEERRLRLVRTAPCWGQWPHQYSASDNIKTILGSWRVKS
jgi:hypothetical protein